jgi:hypothetical protein
MTGRTNFNNDKLPLMNEQWPSSSSLAKHVEHYLSPEHRDDRAGDVPVRLLACDAARRNKEIQAGNLRLVLRKGRLKRSRLSSLSAFAGGPIQHLPALC